MPKGLSKDEIAAILDEENVTELGDSDLSDDADDLDFIGSGSEDDDSELDDVGNSLPSTSVVASSSSNAQMQPPPRKLRADVSCL